MYQINLLKEDHYIFIDRIGLFYLVISNHFNFFYLFYSFLSKKSFSVLLIT